MVQQARATGEPLDPNMLLEGFMKVKVNLFPFLFRAKYKRACLGWTTLSLDPPLKSPSDRSKIPSKFLSFSSLSPSVACAPTYLSLMYTHAGGGLILPPPPSPKSWYGRKRESGTIWVSSRLSPAGDKGGDR